MATSEIARKSFHPTDIPSRARMTTLVQDFQEISGNGIVISKNGHTLCALFNGKFGVGSSSMEKIMESMKKWKEDPAACVPPAGQGVKRKRSYDQRNYVSLEQIAF
jgi:hypothetical protein